MPKRITYRTLCDDIHNLELIVQGGFGHTEKRFDELKDKMNRMEYGLHHLQKDFLVMDEEIRGIHKVIDDLNMRIVYLEDTSGMTPLFPID